MNRNLEEKTRATVLSLTNQANAIGQIGGGPALGWVGSAVSVRAALLGSALTLLPAAAVYAATRPADRVMLRRSRAQGRGTDERGSDGDESRSLQGDL